MVSEKGTRRGAHKDRIALTFPLLEEANLVLRPPKRALGRNPILYWSLSMQFGISQLVLATLLSGFLDRALEAVGMGRGEEFQVQCR